jgi:5'-nucleotidase
MAGAAALLAGLLTACSSSPGAGAAAEASEHGVRSSGGTSAQKSERTTLTVLGTNDVHGHVRRTAVFAGYVDNVRKRREGDGGGVLLVDAGDMWQGTLESNLGEGAAMVQAYAELGYDAATIGNHEFDYGPVGPEATPQSPDDDPRGALKARLREVRFPVVAANLLDAETGERVQWPNVDPSILREVAGIRVGIVGVTSEETLETTISANVKGLEVGPVAKTIEAQATRLREQGAQVIVVAAHAGGDCTRFDDPSSLGSCDRDAEIFEVARDLPQGLVDVIVGGHTHQGIAHEVGGIAIVEAYAKGRAFSRVDLTFDRGQQRVVRTRIHPPEPICADLDPERGRCEPEPYAGAPVEPSEQVLQAVSEHLERAREASREKLGIELEEAMHVDFDEESPLGNFLADLMLRVRSSADVALVNGGGIRADLPAGPLTYGELYEAFPFDNRFATVELPAKALATIFERNLQSEGGFLSVSGVHVRARCTRDGLQVTLMDDDGKPIPPERRLTVLASDFLVTGGNAALTELGRAEQSIAIEDGRPMREIMADRLRKRSGKARPGDGTVYDPERPRVRYPAKRPVECE